MHLAFIPCRNTFVSISHSYSYTGFIPNGDYTPVMRRWDYILVLVLRFYRVGRVKSREARKLNKVWRIFVFLNNKIIVLPTLAKMQTCSFNLKFDLNKGVSRSLLVTRLVVLDMGRL